MTAKSRFIFNLIKLCLCKSFGTLMDQKPSLDETIQWITNFSSEFELFEKQN